MSAKKTLDNKKVKVLLHLRYNKTGKLDKNEFSNKFSCNSLGNYVYRKSSVFSSHMLHEHV